MKKAIDETRSNTDSTLKKYENKIVTLQAELDSRLQRVKDLSSAVTS